MFTTIEAATIQAEVTADSYRITEFHYKPDDRILIFYDVGITDSSPEGVKWLQTNLEADVSADLVNAVATPDVATGTSLRAAIKAALYQLLEDAGVVSAGTVT